LPAVAEAYFTALTVDQKMAITIGRGQEITHFMPANPDLIEPTQRIVNPGDRLLTLLPSQAGQLLLGRQVRLPNLQLYGV
jgi:hypothetical protein